VRRGPKQLITHYTFVKLLVLISTTEPSSTGELVTLLVLKVAFEMEVRAEGQGLLTKHLLAIHMNICTYSLDNIIACM